MVLFMLASGVRAAAGFWWCGLCDRVSAVRQGRRAIQGERFFIVIARPNECGYPVLYLAVRWLTAGCWAWPSVVCWLFDKCPVCILAARDSVRWISSVGFSTVGCWLFLWSSIKRWPWDSDSVILRHSVCNINLTVVLVKYEVSFFGGVFNGVILPCPIPVWLAVFAAESIALSLFGFLNGSAVFSVYLPTAVAKYIPVYSIFVLMLSFINST